MDTQVLIAGGGPVGLMVAMELDKQGIDAILIERNPITTQHPKMDITNGRSMELFRKWGVDKKLRAVAVPEDHGFDVVWAANMAGGEMTRFTYPTPAEYRANAKAANDGSHTLEPAMRVSQILIEPCLKEHIEQECYHIDVRFGWALETFTQDEDGVTSTIKNPETGETKTIRSLYLAGCDGAGSVTRRTLGIELDEFDVFTLITQVGMSNFIPHVIRELLRGLKKPNGKLHMIHFTSPEKAFFERMGQFWHLQSPDTSVLIAQNDKDTWTLHTNCRGDEGTENIDPKERLYKFLGKKIECNISVANAWTPRMCVAKKFGKGRVWLAGDSVRQVIPTGGYGMNTGVGDAAALGWALAANIHGWGTPKLLAAYESERQPVSFRNRDASGAHALIRFKIGAAMRNAMYDDTSKGEKVRKKIGKYIQELGNLENEAVGLEAGYRYDNSPIINYSGEGTPPEFMWEKIYASTYPGLRIPAIWLKDGQPVQDLLGDGFTLLRFANIDTAAFEQAAKDCGLPLTVVDIRDDHAAKIYEKKLILVRPDQHVAWRGDTAPAEAIAIIDQVRGAESSPA